MHFLQFGSLYFDIKQFSYKQMAVSQRISIFLILKKLKYASQNVNIS